MIEHLKELLALKEEAREHQGNEYITLANMERLRRICREALRSLPDMP